MTDIAQTLLEARPNPFAPVNREGHQDLPGLNKIIGTRIIVGEYRTAIISWADFAWLSRKQWPEALPATYTADIRKDQRLSCAVQTWTNRQTIYLAVRHRLAQISLLDVNFPRGLVGPARFTPAAAHDRKAQKLMRDLRDCTLRMEDEDVPITDGDKWDWLDKPWIPHTFDREAIGRADQAVMGRLPPGYWEWKMVHCNAIAPHEKYNHAPKNKVRYLPATICAPGYDPYELGRLSEGLSASGDTLRPGEPPFDIGGYSRTR
jgi:hypothetical protein